MSATETAAAETREDKIKRFALLSGCELFLSNLIADNVRKEWDPLYGLDEGLYLDGSNDLFHELVPRDKDCDDVEDWPQIVALQDPVVARLFQIAADRDYCIGKAGEFTRMAQRAAIQDVTNEGGADA